MAVGHPLRLYNSLGRVLEEFTPRGRTVGMYSCGPTVYGYPHVGNMRAYVFADTLRRALRWKSFEVRHVVNITDVGHVVAETNLGEDKLERAAARERRSVEETAEFYTRAFFDDLAALNVLPAHEYPRATAHVDRMITFAAELERKGFAYQIDSGLYFDTVKSDGYGELAMLNMEGQREGARVEQVAGRRNKADFALWRSEIAGQRRAMRWDSPWGWGAPGWHLECSAMGIHFLGEHFDIHTGGVDHRELHHVNEIAQSEAYLGDGARWVRYWLHNEFVQLKTADLEAEAEFRSAASGVPGQTGATVSTKMSKSVGSTVRIADVVAEGLHPLAYRLFLLGGHYRTPMDFTMSAVAANNATMRRLAAKIAPLRPLPAITDIVAARRAADDRTNHLIDQVDAAISNDLNTPQVLAILQDALKDNDLSDSGKAVLAAACEGLLGLGLADITPDDFEKRRSRDDFSAAEIADIERLVAARGRARDSRDWAAADALRDELAQLGIDVVDSPSGTAWSPRLE